MQIRRRSLCIASIAAALCVLSTMAVAQQGSSAPQSAARPMPIGQFKVLYEKGTMRVVFNGASRSTDFDMRAPRITVTTANYDMSASRITLRLDNRRSVVTAGEASGNVQIEVRDPIQKQTTTLTCPSAIYSYATASKPTRIDLRGPIRSVLRGPAWEQNGPLVQTAQSGYIEFPRPDLTIIVLEDGTATGIPVEPAPKASGKRP